MTVTSFWQRPINVFPALPLLLAAQAVSVLGSAAYSVTVLWYVKTTYGSDALVALFAALGAVVSVLLGVAAGRTADTWDRRWLLLKSDFACVLALLLLLFALRVGAVNLYPVLLGVSVIMGMALVQAEPALLASFPHLTGREGLGRTNALHQLLNSGAGILGAVLGGLLASVTLEVAVTVNLASFLLSFLLVALAQWPAAARGRTAGGRAEVNRAEPQPRLSVGASLRTHPLVAHLVVLVSVFMFLAAPLPALLPALAHDHLNAGATALGMLEAALGAGFVLGGLLAMSGVQPRNLRELCLPLLVAGVVRLGLGEIHTLWLAAGLLVLNGAALATAGIAAMTLLQKQIPEGERGAALGLTFSLTDAARPAGLALATALLPALHLPGVLHWSGLGLMLLGVAGWVRFKTV